MIEDNAISMGAAITAAREDRGLERRALADAAGVSHPYLGELEMGRRSGTPQVLERIASALSVTSAELHSAASAISSGEPASFPPRFLYAGAGSTAASDPAVDVRTRAGAEPAVNLRPLVPRTLLDEEVVIQKLTSRIRVEVQRWLDNELEPAVRAEVRRQRGVEE